MVKSDSGDDRSEPPRDETVIFQPGPMKEATQSESADGTDSPKIREIDTATQGFIEEPEFGSPGLKSRRTSPTTSGFGSHLHPSGNSPSSGLAEPVTDPEELKRILLSMEFVTSDQWDQAFGRAGDNPTVVSILSQFMTMSAGWDPKANLLTEYQIDEISAGRASELRFNQYLVLSLLGEGGMGKVYKARHIYLDVIHALKTIRRDLFGESGSGNPDAIQTMVKRFLGEFRGMARLLVAKDPDHFAQVHDAGDSDGIPYYAMEFIDGKSVDDIIKEQTATGEFLPLAESLTLFAEIAEAVGTAHDLNIIHRDLTPRNIMITQRGRPKIIDFGIAKELKQDEQTGEATAGLSELTTSGQQVGSRPYMSPEQHAGDIERINYSTDVYVLAATLFQYLTLQLPFPGTTAMEVMLKHLSPDRPQPSAIRPDVPAELDDVVQKALAIEPADRYKTIREFKDALLAVREVVIDPSLARRKPKATKARGPLAAILLLLAIAAGGTYVVWSSPLRPSSKDASGLIEGQTTSRGGDRLANGGKGVAQKESRFDQISKQIESLKAASKHSEVIAKCQSSLADKSLSSLERKKLIDDLLDATAKEYIPPTSPDDAASIVKIVQPLEDGSSPMQYAVHGLLSRAIAETSLAHRDILKTLVAGSKTGDAPRSAAIDRLKYWWNDSSAPFSDRLDCLRQLRELAPSDAMILGQSVMAHEKDAAKHLANQNPDQAIAKMNEVRQLASQLEIPAGDPILTQVARWEALLKLPALDPNSISSAKSFVEGLPTSRAELESLDGTHAELELSQAKPSDLAAQAIDAWAKEILASPTVEEREKINGLNDIAIKLGVADRSSQLAKHFGSQAFKEILDTIADPNFDMATLEKRLRDLGDRLNDDQRGAVDAVKSVRLKAYVAAAAKFREVKLNTSDAPWAPYRAEAIIEETGSELNKEKPDMDAVTRSVTDLESTYKLSSNQHPRFAAIKARVEANAHHFQEAVAALTQGLDAVRAEPSRSSLWSLDSGKQELRDAARGTMDLLVTKASEAVNSREDASEFFSQAETIANFRLLDGNPLGLDEDGKNAFRSRSSRISYLRGRFNFSLQKYADAAQQFRKLDATLLAVEPFRDAKGYWLLSQAYAEGSLPGKLVASDDAPVIPSSLQGTPEEHLLLALWEMARDLGTTTQAKTLAVAANYSASLRQFLEQRQKVQPLVPSSNDAVANVLHVYLGTMVDLPGKTQGWERAINLSQLIDDKIADQEKSLRQVETLTQDAIAIAALAGDFVKEADLVGIKRISLLMSTKPVGIYSSVVKETPIGENTPYKYYVFFNEAYNKEFLRYMTWSAARIDAIGANNFATDPTIGPFIAVWNRARMRFAYFQQDWALCIRCARGLVDLDSALRDEQPETEMANLYDAFFRHSQGKSADEVNRLIGEATDPAQRQLTGKDYSPNQLNTLKRWKSMFQMISHLNGQDLPEADRKQAIQEIETLLTTWNGTDTAAVKWPIWERPALLGYYQKYSAEAKEPLQALARLPVPRLSPGLEKSLSAAALAWKVPPKS
ncbi:serine/threonine protein kinase [bacterium]|nr:serine/threonine protein kinase [bacterium]